MFIYRYVKKTLGPNLTPRKHNLIKLELALHEDASTKVTVFLAKWEFFLNLTLNFQQVFFLNFLFEKSCMAFYFNKLELPSLKDEFLSPKYALCQVWLKLAQWFKRKSKNRRQKDKTDWQQRKLTWAWLQLRWARNKNGECQYFDHIYYIEYFMALYWYLLK